MVTDILPVLVPTIGAALLFTCVNGCFVRGLALKVRALQQQVTNLELAQQQAPRVIVQAPPVAVARYPPPYYPAPAAGAHPPPPSAPPAQYAYAGPSRQS
jgi:hypothetical protein